MSGHQDGWVIVTGAAGSLGNELSQYWATRGRPVLALDLLAPPTIHSGVVHRKVNLLDSEALEVVINEVLQPAQKIATLVNLVGLIVNEPIVRFAGGRLKPHEVGIWKSTIDANLTAPFVCASVVGARMARAGSGSIVNFSSIAAKGNPGQAAYSAAKSGLEGLTRTMALELGPMGVRTNAIALGFVDVSSTRSALPDTALDELRDRTPLKRLGAIADVISAVEFLETTTFMNGDVLQLDGALRLS